MSVRDLRYAVIGFFDSVGVGLFMSQDRNFVQVPASLRDRTTQRCGSINREWDSNYDSS
jgi:hypothetical protein